MADQFKTPKDVTDYFDQKALKPAFSYLDVWGEEHAHNFTVAKVTETELLDSFQKSISKASKDGQGLETWKADVLKELRRLGWAEPRRVSDPTGQDDDKLVDFSSPRRLKTIFDSNMRSAQAAGQWQRIQRTKKAMPFILYVRSTSTNPRAAHLAFEGIILPVDDPFWKTHFPPNGWGCKCAVRSITAREARRLGYDPDLGGPQIVWRTKINRRTGEIIKTPEGIDPGWHTNPGLARAKGLTDRLAKRLQDAGEELATRQVRDFWLSPERKVLANLPEKGLSLPAGVRPELAEELGAKGSMVSVFADTVRTKTGKAGETASRAQAFDQLNNILDLGTIIDEGRPDARTLFGFDGVSYWSAVVQKASTGFLRVITFHQLKKRTAEKLMQMAKDQWRGD